jgi:hypothetical protein
VREPGPERLTVRQAAEKLGLTESAVRKRARRGQIRSEKVREGNKERLYIYLDPDEERFPEPFREKYTRSLEERVKTLEEEVYRQQAIILSLSESLKALHAPEEPPEGAVSDSADTGGGAPSPGLEEEEGSQRGAQAEARPWDRVRASALALVRRWFGG